MERIRDKYCWKQNEMPLKGEKTLSQDNEELIMFVKRCIEDKPLLGSVFISNLALGKLEEPSLLKISQVFITVFS